MGTRDSVPVHAFVGSFHAIGLAHDPQIAGRQPLAAPLGSLHCWRARGAILISSYMVQYINRGGARPGGDVPSPAEPRAGLPGPSRPRAGSRVESPSPVARTRRLVRPRLRGVRVTPRHQTDRPRRDSPWTGVCGPDQVVRRPATSTFSALPDSNGETVSLASAAGTSRLTSTR